MNPGGWTLLVVVAITIGIGLAWRSRQGRIRRPRDREDRMVDHDARGVTDEDGSPDGNTVTPEESTAKPEGKTKTGFHRLPEGLRDRLVDQPHGTRVTLLQLSTTFCAPCRHTRYVLADMAARTDGLRHVDIDLADHPEWSTPLGVHTTPTTLALDHDGHELFRFNGVPRREELGAALAERLS